MIREQQQMFVLFLTGSAALFGYQNSSYAVSEVVDFRICYGPGRCSVIPSPPSAGFPYLPDPRPPLPDPPFEWPYPPDPPPGLPTFDKPPPQDPVDPIDGGSAAGGGGAGPYDLCVGCEERED